MKSSDKLVALMRERLAEIDVERDKLVSLLGVYEAEVVAKPPQNGKRKPKRQGNPFQAREGGPTQRLIATIGACPGMKYGEVLDLAVVGLSTDAGNPRHSLGSTLGSLVKSTKVKKIDGRYYLPGDVPK